MASRGLRCICLAYRDYAAVDGSRPADFFEDADRVDNDLIAMAIVGIKDPVRCVMRGGVWLWVMGGIQALPSCGWQLAGWLL
jgi:hypothetical protein